jgi:RNA recognition motif-containing protein
MVMSFVIIGLSYGVDDQSLRDAFATYGEVIEGEFILA